MKSYLRVDQSNGSIILTVTNVATGLSMACAYEDKVELDTVREKSEEFKELLSTFDNNLVATA